MGGIQRRSGEVLPAFASTVGLVVPGVKEGVEVFNLGVDFYGQSEHGYHSHMASASSTPRARRWRTSSSACTSRCVRS